MPESTTLGPASPFFIVSDFDLSLDFYTKRLGFDCRFQAPPDQPFFAVVGRDSAQVMLKEIAPDVRPQPNPLRHPWASWDAFVYVPDPDALAAEFAGRGTAFHQALGDTVLFFGRPK